MTTRIKIIRKPTPVKNAVLWVSLTSNVFLGAMGYAVATGHMSRVEPAVEQADYLTQITRR